MITRTERAYGLSLLGLLFAAGFMIAILWGGYFSISH
jgi:uncharacterized membrane protein YciS (DUF1049 family)